MRFLLTLAVASSAVSSFATFEMGLIAQGNKIFRYDPINSISLGSISMVNSSCISICSEGSLNTVYALSGDRVFKYNFSTGDYLGNFAVSAGATSLNKGMNENEILVGYANSVERRNVSTGAQVGVNLAWSGGGFTYFEGAVAMRATGKYYLISERTTYPSSTNDYLIGVDANSTWVGNYENTGAFAFSDAHLWNADVSGTQIMYSMQNTLSSNQFTPVTVQKNTGNDSLSVVFQNIAFGGLGQRTYVGYGHLDSQIIIRNFGGQWTCIRGRAGDYNSPSSVISALNQSAPINGFSMVTAPEPVSLTVLGLGTLLLARRRAKRD